MSIAAAPDGNLRTAELAGNTARFIIPTAHFRLRFEHQRRSQPESDAAHASPQIDHCLVIGADDWPSSSD